MTSTNLEALDVDEPNPADLSALQATTDRAARARIVAEVVFAAFNDYYHRSRKIAYQARDAFEARDWPSLLKRSHQRLTMYAGGLQTVVPGLRASCPEIGRDDGFFDDIERCYLSLIAGRYEADLAFAFLHSMRRLVFDKVWRPVRYRPDGETADRRPCVVKRIETTVPVSSSCVEDVLSVAGLGVGWRDKRADMRLVGLEITRRLLHIGLKTNDAILVEMLDAGFFRNRGACVVGRIIIDENRHIPLLIALLHGRDGVFVDAVLFESDELQYVFSSSLANFHATNPHYHELAAFLHGLMPKRPLGTHYSTIGFNHVGKAAVMDEIALEQTRSGEQLDTAPGFRGTVAIGFSMPSSAYVLKIIRDKPTAGYKWSTFDGVEAVLAKYRLVHAANRSGSMLDNIIYNDVTLGRDMFAPDLLDELLDAGAQTVSVSGDTVSFRHLVVQMKMTPIPEYLKKASDDEALRAVLNLGDCIKNNAAANIFNKDLDSRNYGVSAIMRVYLFDYDAVEPLTNVKIRTNAGREEGEEDIPEWFFEQGTIFLPEEIMTGLRIDRPELRRAFREAHADLLTTDYWNGMQQALNAGKVPKVRAYPASRRLHRHGLRLARDDASVGVAR